MYEPYRRPPSPGGKDAAEPAGVAGAGNGSADVAKPGVAAISMIHASFHDHDASIYAPRRPRVPTSAAGKRGVPPVSVRAGDRRTIWSGAFRANARRTVAAASF